MVYKTISPKALIAKIYRDYKPNNSSWINDAYEWMGEAIDCIKPFMGYIEKSKCIKVCDYRAKIPCDLDQLLGIEYKHTKLQRTGAINSKHHCHGTKHLPICLDASYSLNPNYIHTSFKEGEITVYYNGIATDDDGLPLIIDSYNIKEAISWYILMKMCLRGYKHSVVTFQMAEAEWTKFYPRAQNECKMPDIDGYDLFKRTYMGLTRNTNMSDELFQDNSVTHDFQIKSY
jgi:hypothetical protein